MGVLIHLGEVVAFKLIDEKDIPGQEFIYPAVDQKLLSAGDGEINLTAVVYVDAHGTLVVIQPGDGEAFSAQAGLDCRVAGMMDEQSRTSFHGPFCVACPHYNLQNRTCSRCFSVFYSFTNPGQDFLCIPLGGEPFGGRILTPVFRPRENLHEGQANAPAQFVEKNTCFCCFKAL
jgi:hypothetical protein